MLEHELITGNVLDIARRAPARPFVTILTPGKPAQKITYGDLVANAWRFARYLKERGVRRGEVVVLIQKHGAEIAYAFLGAMLAGAIPSIFAYPSTKISAASHYGTLSHLLEICETRFVVTYADLERQLIAAGGPARDVVIVAESGYASFPSTPEPVPLEPGDTALLQHSSGTTGLKKGVALSHRSVINQLRNYAAAIRLSDGDTIVSWLPLYHDMGLIACFVLPLTAGVPLALLSPFDWVANPVSLFEAITAERGTLCWLPNFAYNFLASNVSEAQLKDVNVRSMRAFVNCAEPVSAGSHEIFATAFASIGVSARMLGTCYAMAENTFAVTQGGISSPARVEELDGTIFSAEHRAEVASGRASFRRRAASSGELIANNRLKIVDESGGERPERHIGEIAIKSDSLLTDYFHRPDLTQAAIRDGWYFTGDLGYMADGHLFVTGRKKDMIIVAGKNIYPQDIEEIVSGFAGVHPGRTVAFGVYEEAAGTEDVVILAETDETDESKWLPIKLAIARAVRDQLECIANDVVILPHRWLVKSSSGKISRPGNKEKYLREIRRIDVLQEERPT